MSDFRYRVSWETFDPKTRKKVIHYGIYIKPEWHKEEYRAAKLKKGEVLVEDIITPQGFIVPEIALKDVPNADDCSNDPIYKLQEAECIKAEELSAKLGDGLKVGKIFRMSVADGYAHYVVTKVGKRNVTIEWRGFGGDRYTDRILGWGGQFARDIIEPLVDCHDGMLKLFGVKRKLKAV